MQEIFSLMLFYHLRRVFGILFAIVFFVIFRPVIALSCILALPEVS